MAQADTYEIVDQKASSARTAINAALSAIVTNNSGLLEPTAMFDNMIWYDTTNDLLKIRDAGNTFWITLGTVDQGNSKFEPNQTIATQAEAEAGTQSSKLMTSQRVAQAITAQVVIPEGLGEEQEYSNPTRAVNTWYQNTSGKPIMVFIRLGVNPGLSLRVGVSTTSYISWSAQDGDSGTYDMCTFIVPDSYYYYGEGGTLRNWVEMS
jgi:hypothetical protein